MRALALLLAAPGAHSARAGAWREEFLAPNLALFMPHVGIHHDFEANNSMLAYGADLGGGRRGLEVTCSALACAGCSAAGDACYDAGTQRCTNFTSQYLMSADAQVKGFPGNYFTYGDYEVSMRTGHRADGSAAAGTWSCFTPGSTPSHNDYDPLHNEIALCIDGDSPSRAKMLYWYNSTLQKTEVELGFDSSAALHTYTVSWRQNRIAWGVDGQVVHVDKGVPRVTIPWEPTAIIVGLLKPSGVNPSRVTSFQHVEHVSYTPCSSDC